MGEGRRLEKEVVLNATPEQVWEAIATGPGISTWFVPHEVEPGEGGRCTADFGSGNVVTDGRVLAWEPGRRVVYGSADRPGFAMEFLIEGRRGDGTVLRFVQSGFLDGEDWESEYDSYDSGWNLFFHNLAEYFEHFAGLPVINVVTMNVTKLEHEAVWERFHRELGADPAAATGDRVHLTPDGTEAIVGVVDVRNRGALGIRTDDGFYRFVGEGADGWGGVGANHYYYGVDVDRTERTAAWQAWLDRLFPASE